jgi:AhpD family alkylhydroperoxidase
MNMENKMENRLNVHQQGQGALKALYSLGIYLSKSVVEQPLLQLVYFRVSQINGCAFCLDMHAKDLRAHGETEQRLYMLAGWRDAPQYTERERAALAWAEALTGADAPADLYEAAKAQFSEEELIDLTFGIIAINSYNRVNIAFGAPAGTYQPAAVNA